MYLEDIFNPSVPEKFICVGARWRQFGGFLPLRRESTRLRDRGMSWIVSKGRAALFLSCIVAGTSVKYYVLSQLKKFVLRFFFKFHDFSILRADCARLRDHRILKRVLLKLQFMI